LTDKEEWEREQAGYETVDDDDEATRDADKKEGGASQSLFTLTDIGRAR